jgi:hypothetical protein
MGIHALHLQYTARSALHGHLLGPGSRLEVPLEIRGRSKTRKPVPFKAAFSGRCAECGAQLEAGTTVTFSGKQVVHF